MLIFFKIELFVPKQVIIARKCFSLTFVFPIWCVTLHMLR